MNDCFFFENQGYNLYGHLYTPNKSDKQNGIGIVLCAPFAEEKLWSHRVFVNFARLLAENGYTALCFDYMGCGDSEGNFEDSDIESRIADIARAVDVVKDISNVKKLGLIGLRLGATLSAVSAEQNTEPDFMILWEPIIEVSRYLNQCLRSNLSTQMATYKKIKYNRDEMIQNLLQNRSVNIDGYLMPGKFYQQASGINLIEMPVKFQKPVFITHISRKEKDKAPNSETFLYNKYFKLNSCSELQVIKEEPFWGDVKLYYQRAEKLFHNTLTWLNNLETLD